VTDVDGYWQQGRGCESWQGRRGEGRVPQNLQWGDADANCLPRFSKNTAQSSSKRAISSENFNFYGDEA